MEWQKIETAPMNGTWLLVTGFKQGKIKSISHRYAVAAWYPLNVNKPELGGRWFFADDEKGYVREPTHWSHLPVLPEGV
jgi:hypothetical protein